MGAGSRFVGEGACGGGSGSGRLRCRWGFQVSLTARNRVHSWRGRWTGTRAGRDGSETARIVAEEQEPARSAKAVVTREEVEGLALELTLGAPASGTAVLPSRPAAAAEEGTS